MRKQCLSSAAALFIATATFLPAALNPSFQPTYSKVPLAFEENRGQAPAGVSYLSHTRGGSVTLRPSRIQLEHQGGKPIVMRFAGSAAVRIPAGEQKLPGITSYLVGPESDRIRGVPNFAIVYGMHPSIPASTPSFMAMDSISSTTSS